MQTRRLLDLVRLGLLASVAFASIALVHRAAGAGDAAIVPLPGASGPPWVEVGKVNVVGIEELPRAMQDEARRTLQREGARAQGAPGAADASDYGEVDEDDWQWPDPAAPLYPSFAAMNEGRVLIRPRDLARTELASYRFLGLVDNTARPGEPVLTIAREFERPDGVLVELVENDLAGNGAVVMVRELIHDRVESWPAVFAVQRAPSGRVRSVIDWADDGEDFTLMVLDDVRHPAGAAGYDKAWMFRLARSIQLAPRLRNADRL